MYYAYMNVSHRVLRLFSTPPLIDYASSYWLRLLLLTTPPLIDYASSYWCVFNRMGFEQKRLKRPTRPFNSQFFLFFLFFLFFNFFSQDGGWLRFQIGDFFCFFPICFLEFCMKCFPGWGLGRRDQGDQRWRRPSGPSPFNRLFFIFF